MWMVFWWDTHWEMCGCSIFFSIIPRHSVCISMLLTPRSSYFYPFLGGSVGRSRYIPLRLFVYNYGHLFMYWDWALGTYRPARGVRGHLLNVKPGLAPNGCGIGGYHIKKYQIDSLFGDPEERNHSLLVSIHPGAWHSGISLLEIGHLEPIREFFHQWSLGWLFLVFSWHRQSPVTWVNWTFANYGQTKQCFPC